MKKGVLLPSLLTLAWIVALPWLSRLWRGPAWAAQYFPDPGAEVWGMVFILAFFSLPAIPLLIALKRDGAARPSYWIALATASVLTALAHFDWDLAADAQAAIWLVMAPCLILGITWGAEAIVHRVQTWRASRQVQKS